jgi:hypothetical protein
VTYESFRTNFGLWPVTIWIERNGTVNLAPTGEDISRRFSRLWSVRVSSGETKFWLLSPPTDPDTNNNFPPNIWPFPEILGFRPSLCSGVWTLGPNSSEFRMVPSTTHAKTQGSLNLVEFRDLGALRRSSHSQSAQIWPRSLAVLVENLMCPGALCISQQSKMSNLRAKFDAIVVPNCVIRAGHSKNPLDLSCACIVWHICKIHHTKFQAATAKQAFGRTSAIRIWYVTHYSDTAPSPKEDRRVLNS